MNKNERVFYPCFSPNEKDYLMHKGHRYLLKCRHIDTHNMQWIFLFDSDGLLDKSLKEYSEGSKC